jgi:hypothetical protein
VSPSNVFQLEFLYAVGNIRSLSRRIGLAFLLGAPFVFAAMPVEVKATGLVMLSLFVGFFGAAVGTARARLDGRATQLRLLPLTPLLVWLDRVWAGSLIDLLQVGPPIVLLLLVEGSSLSPSAWTQVLGSTCAVLLLLNMLGNLLGTLVKGNAEIHLAGALAVGFIAFFSGLMPTPAAIGPLMKATASWSPVLALKAAMVKACGGGAEVGGATVYSMAGVPGMAALLLPALVRMVGLPAGRRAERTAESGN